MTLVKCQMKNYVKKWDNKLRMMGLESVLNPRYFSYKHLQRGVNLILFHSVFIQSRGFKTLKSRTRRLQSTSERLAESQHIAPSFVKVIRHFVVWKSSLLKIIKMRTFNIWFLLLVSWFSEGLITYVIITPPTLVSVLVMSLLWPVRHLLLFFVPTHVPVCSLC